MASGQRTHSSYKAGADTVQYGATLPPVPASQTLNGLGFLYFEARFGIKVSAKSCDKQGEIPDFGLTGMYR